MNLNGGFHWLTHRPSTKRTKRTTLLRPQPTKVKRAQEARAAEARKIFDDNEADKDDRAVTTQTDQLIRSSEMERVGPSAWMAESERRIADRQGSPPAEPRQVHGVAPVQKPR